MFDKETLAALQQSEAINSASESIKYSDSTERLVALPSDFKLHDLEPYLPLRRRARGTMSTESVSSFANYVQFHAEPKGSSVFIDADSMSAVAVLNLGTTDDPGHADNRAKLSLRQTAAYGALKAHASGQAISQAKVAEFMEDWSHVISCFNDTTEMRVPQAIAAMRDITIDTARKVESQEQQLSASRSALESVTASSKHILPTHIYFKCAPYADLEERTFVMRLGIQTGGDKIGVALRIVRKEVHDEDMAQEFARLIQTNLTNVSIQVLVGSYTKG